jgi:hypothetical protein
LPHSSGGRSRVCVTEAEEIAAAPATIAGDQVLASRTMAVRCYARTATATRNVANEGSASTTRSLAWGDGPARTNVGVTDKRARRTTSMPDGAMDQMKEHLEYLGYEIEKLGEDGFHARHGTFFNLTFKKYGFGVLATAFFDLNDAGKQSRLDLLKRVNAYNREARVTRCYVDEDGDLAVEGWYASAYEKVSFGAFMQGLNEDCRFLGEDGSKLNEFLS